MMSDAETPNKTSKRTPDERFATSGDRVETFYAQNGGEIYGTLLYMLGNAEDAADAFQDAFIKCWKNIEQAGELRSLRAWIFRVVINTARDARRAAWRRRKKPLDTEMAAQLTSSIDTEADADRNRQIVALREQIAELPEPQREVFLLRQNGSLTYDQIARMLELPVGTVKTRMRSAVLSLRRVFSEP